MSQISDIFSKNPSVGRYMSDFKVGAILKANWETLFGKLHRDLSFLYFSRGVLTIEARNAMWITEIDYYKPTLMAKMNELLKGQGRVVDFSIKKAGKVAPVAESRPHLDVSDFSLEEKIKRTNAHKRSLGYKLCTSCNEVLTPDTICDYCRMS